jgi:hypothetical protein
MSTQPELLDCKFCRTTPNAGDPSCCQTLAQAYEQTPERQHGCPWFDQEDRKRNPKSAAPEPVRPAQPVSQSLPSREVVAREIRRAMLDNPTDESFNKRAEKREAIADATADVILARFAAQCAPQPSGDREDVKIRISNVDATIQSAVRGTIERCAKVAEDKFAGTLTSNIGKLIADDIRSLATIPDSRGTPPTRSPLVRHDLGSDAS